MEEVVKVELLPNDSAVTRSHTAAAVAAASERCPSTTPAPDHNVTETHRIESRNDSPMRDHSAPVKTDERIEDADDIIIVVDDSLEEALNRDRRVDRNRGDDNDGERGVRCSRGDDAADDGNNDSLTISSSATSSGSSSVASLPYFSLETVCNGHDMTAHSRGTAHPLDDTVSDGSPSDTTPSSPAGDRVYFEQLARVYVDAGLFVSEDGVEPATDEAMTAGTNTSAPKELPSSEALNNMIPKTMPIDAVQRKYTKGKTTMRSGFSITSALIMRRSKRNKSKTLSSASNPLDDDYSTVNESLSFQPTNVDPTIIANVNIVDRLKTTEIDETGNSISNTPLIDKVIIINALNLEEKETLLSEPAPSLETSNISTAGDDDSSVSYPSPLMKTTIHIARALPEYVASTSNLGSELEATGNRAITPTTSSTSMTGTTINPTTSSTSTTATIITPTISSTSTTGITITPTTSTTSITTTTGTTITSNATSSLNPIIIIDPITTIITSPVPSTTTSTTSEATSSLNPIIMIDPIPTTITSPVPSTTTSTTSEATSSLNPIIIIDPIPTTITSPVPSTTTSTTSEATSSLNPIIIIDLIPTTITSPVLSTHNSTATASNNSTHTITTSSSQMTTTSSTSSSIGDAPTATTSTDLTSNNSTPTTTTSSAMMTTTSCISSSISSAPTSISSAHESAIPAPTTTPGSAPASLLIAGQRCPNFRVTVIRPPSAERRVVLNPARSHVLDTYFHQRGTSGDGERLRDLYELYGVYPEDMTVKLNLDTGVKSWFMFKHPPREGSLTVQLTV